jgi:hypothetical protein
LVAKDLPGENLHLPGGAFGLVTPASAEARRQRGRSSLVATMAAGAGDHLMLNRLGLGEDNAEKAGSSTLLLHESVVSCRTPPQAFMTLMHLQYGWFTSGSARTRLR